MKNFGFLLSIAMLFFVTQTDINAQQLKKGDLKVSSSKSVNKVNKGSSTTLKPASNNSRMNSSRTKGSTNSKQSSNNNVTKDGNVSINKSSFHSYMLLSGTNETYDSPAAQIKLFDSSMKQTAELNFFNSSTLIQKASSKMMKEVDKNKIYSLTYPMEMFDYFVNMLENGKKLEVHYNNVDKTVSVATSPK